MSSAAADTPPSPCIVDLVKDSTSLLAVLWRLRNANEAVLFYNRDGSLKLMLRNDPQDLDTLACDLCIVTDEEDDTMQRLLELHPDGYTDDPTTYVLDNWQFDASKVVARDMDKVVAAINAAHLLRVCPCRRYLIKDDAAYCFYCHMTSTPSDQQHDFCPICYDDGVRMHMTVLPCCSQALHRQCLSTWKSKSDRCPLCRAPTVGGEC